MSNPTNKRDSEGRPATSSASSSGSSGGLDTSFEAAAKEGEALCVKYDVNDAHEEQEEEEATATAVDDDEEESRVLKKIKKVVHKAQKEEPNKLLVCVTSWRLFVAFLVSVVFAFGWKDEGITQTSGNESPSCPWWVFRVSTITWNPQGKILVVDKKASEQAVAETLSDPPAKDIGAIKMQNLGWIFVYFLLRAEHLYKAFAQRLTPNSVRDGTFRLKFSEIIIVGILMFLAWCYGLYAQSPNGEVMYIGYTEQSMQKRDQQHEYEPVNVKAAWWRRVIPWSKWSRSVVYKADNGETRSMLMSMEMMLNVATGATLGGNLNCRILDRTTGYETKITRAGVRKVWEAARDHVTRLDANGERVSTGRTLPPEDYLTFWQAFYESTLKPICPRLSLGQFQLILQGHEWRFLTERHEFQFDNSHFATGHLPVRIAPAEDAAKRLVVAQRVWGTTSPHLQAANEAKKRRKENGTSSTKHEEDGASTASGTRASNSVADSMRKRLAAAKAKKAEEEKEKGKK